jgi:hypothetical protein
LNVLKNNVRCLAGIFAGLLMFSGCKVKMSSEERVGQSEIDAMNDSQITFVNADHTEYPSVTVEYQDYDLNFLAETLWGLTPEIIENNKQDNIIMLPTGKEQDTYQIPQLAVYDGNSGLNFWRYSDMDCYRVVFDIAYENSDLPFQPSVLAKTFQLDGDSAVREQAQETVSAVLEQIGFISNSVDVFYFDKDSLNQLQKVDTLLPPGYERDENGNPVYKSEPWETEDEAFGFLVKPQYQNIPIESFYGEAMLTMVYQIGKQEIVYAKTSMPVLTDHVVSEKTNEIISGKDAALYASELLSELSGEKNQEISRAELLYAFSTTNKDVINHTVTLDPCWKVSYHTDQDDTVEQFILINAVTGEMLSNQTGL